MANMANMANKNMMAKLAAAAYVIWGLLHFQAAYSVYRLGRSLEPGMVHGRVLQDAWNLFFFSVAAIGTALFLNWRNDRWGYWINFGVVSVADLGFIFFVLMAGLLLIWPGILGPIFWILGLVFSTIALRQRRAS